MTFLGTIVLGYSKIVFADKAAFSEETRKVLFIFKPRYSFTLLEATYRERTGLRFESSD